MAPVLPAVPLPRQLPLPLAAADPSPRPVLRGPHQLPPRVWRGLLAEQQTQVRRTVRRVCQEIVRDRAGRS